MVGTSGKPVEGNMASYTRTVELTTGQVITIKGWGIGLMTKHYKTIQGMIGAFMAASEDGAQVDIEALVQQQVLRATELLNDSILEDVDVKNIHSVYDLVSIFEAVDSVNRLFDSVKKLTGMMEKLNPQSS